MKKEKKRTKSLMDPECRPLRGNALNISPGLNNESSILVRIHVDLETGQTSTSPHSPDISERESGYWDASNIP